MLDFFSVPHLLLVMVIAMILFGTKKLPEIGAGLGRAIRDFRRAASEPDTGDLPRRESKAEDVGRDS